MTSKPKPWNNTADKETSDSRYHHSLKISDFFATDFSAEL